MKRNEKRRAEMQIQEKTRKTRTYTKTMQEH